MSRRDGHFWIRFEPTTWLTDPALSKCEPATRGIWVDWLCVMWQDNTYRLRGTHEQLARMARCTPLEAEATIADLRAHRAADVTRSHGKVTLISRRFKRELGARKSANDRKIRQRKRQGTARSREKSRPRHATEVEVEVELEEEEDPLEEENGTSDEPENASASEAKGTSEKELAHLFLNPDFRHAARVEFLWKMVWRGVPELDDNALRRLKDSLIMMNLNVPAAHALGRAVRDLKNARHPSSRLMTICKNLMRQYPGEEG